MAFGMRVRDPVTGEILVDYTTSITRKLGKVSTTTAAGSVTDARFTAGEGEPWSTTLGNISFDSFGKEVSIVGNVLSWTASNFAADIIYGLRS